MKHNPPEKSRRELEAEIRRLRAALLEIVRDAEDTSFGSGLLLYRMSHRAKDALAGKEKP